MIMSIEWKEGAERILTTLFCTEIAARGPFLAVVASKIVIEVGSQVYDNPEG